MSATFSPALLASGHFTSQFSGEENAASCEVWSPFHGGEGVGLAHESGDSKIEMRSGS